jgi:ankyrin repeat protein
MNEEEREIAFPKVALRKNLIKACKENNLEEIKELIKMGVDCGGYWEVISPLEIVIEKKNIEAVKLLIAAGVSVYRGIAPFASTFLHLAASTGVTEIAKVIIEAGLDVNQLNSLGRSPLHYAISAGEIEMTKFLIEAGADVNLTADESYITPLYMAIGCNQLEIAAFLIKAGATQDKVEKKIYEMIKEITERSNE